MAGTVTTCTTGDKKSKMKTRGRKKKTDRSPVDLDTNIDNNRRMLRDRGNFICSICSSTFKNGEQLHKHFKQSRCALGSLNQLINYTGQNVQNINHNETATVKYECGYCNMVFPDCSHLEIHISGGCPGVSKGTNRSVSSSNNSEILHKSTEVECGLCRIKFVSFKDLILHIKSKHDEEEDNENDVDMFKDKLEYVCGNCNVEFKCSKEMRSHMQLCFAESNAAYTHGRLDKFENDSTSQSHISESQTESEYLCGQCGNSFESSESLVKHIATVHSVPGVLTVPEISAAQRSPVKDYTSAHISNDVTVPTSLLIRYMSTIQCEGCLNYSKLNLSDKCILCNQSIHVKLDQVICLCAHIPFMTLESLVFHLRSCKDLQAVTNRNNLVLRYSKNDYKRRLCVNEQAGGSGLLHGNDLNEDFETQTDDISKLRKQRSVIIEDYDSDSTDTDSSGFEEIGFEEILIDRDNITQSNRRVKDENGLAYLLKYDILPCKVVLERMSDSEIEFYQGKKRKRIASPDESERTKFKQARTDKFDRKTEKKSDTSSVRKGKFQGSYSENEGKCKQSKLTNWLKNENSIERNSPNKSMKHSYVEVNKKQLIQKKKLKVSRNIDDYSLHEHQFDEEEEEEMEEDVYTCEICTASFTSTEDLERHSETHLQVYRCKECDQTFASSNDLIKHADSHALPEEYVCGICQCKFSVQEKLENHMMKHFSNIKLQESSTIVTADSSTTSELSFHTKDTNQVQQILPKLLAYKPKF